MSSNAWSLGKEQTNKTHPCSISDPTETTWTKMLLRLSGYEIAKKSLWSSICPLSQAFHKSLSHQIHSFSTTIFRSKWGLNYIPLDPQSCMMFLKKWVHQPGTPPVAVVLHGVVVAWPAAGLANDPCAALGQRGANFGARKPWISHHLRCWHSSPIFIFFAAKQRGKILCREWFGWLCVFFSMKKKEKAWVKLDGFGE